MCQQSYPPLSAYGRQGTRLRSEIVNSNCEYNETLLVAYLQPNRPLARGGREL